MFNLNASNDSEAGHFDCYKDGKYVITLTCGMQFNLYGYNDNIIVVGRVKHHNANNY